MIGTTNTKNKISKSGIDYLEYKQIKKIVTGFRPSYVIINVGPAVNKSFSVYDKNLIDEYLNVEKAIYCGSDKYSVVKLPYTSTSSYFPVISNICEDGFEIYGAHNGAVNEQVCWTAIE